MDEVVSAPVTLLERFGVLTGRLQSVLETVEQTGEDIRGLRAGQGEANVRLAALQASNDALAKRVDNLSDRVDGLVELRNKFGGALLMVAFLFGGLGHYATQIGHWVVSGFR